MTEELAVREDHNVLSIPDLVGQVTLIQEAMSAVMKQDEHYGVIPGTGNKPTLLKPGAEKLCLLFRLNPDYEILTQTHEAGLIHYVVRCTLSHIDTGHEIASGLGSCNSREKKYRWRMIPTDLKPSKEEAEILKAQDKGGWRKLQGKWVWHEKVEADPWDFDNTLLKMASKRALVAAVLNGTAASDLFTQDVEDLPDFQKDNEEKKTTAGAAVTEKTLTALQAALEALKDDEDWHTGNVMRNAERKFGREVHALEDLTEDQAQTILTGALLTIEAKTEEGLITTTSGEEIKL